MLKDKYNHFSGITKGLKFRFKKYVYSHHPCSSYVANKRQKQYISYCSLTPPIHDNTFNGYKI